MASDDERITELETITRLMVGELTARVGRVEAELATRSRSVLHDSDHARLDLVENNLVSLANQLYGDKEAMAKYTVALQRYQEARRGYVAPNVPPTAPEQGDIEAITASLELLAASDVDLERKITRVDARIDRDDTFTDKVGAWIGPLLDDPNFAPPLNGHQVASKTWVDGQLATLAGAIRSEVHDARFLASAFADWGKDLLGLELSRKAPITTLILGAFRELQATWGWTRERMRETFAKVNKPSRLTIARKALGQILTGDVPRE